MSQFIENKPEEEYAEGLADLQKLMALIQDTLTVINQLGNGPVNDMADLHRLRQSNRLLKRCVSELDKMMEARGERNDRS